MEKKPINVHEYQRVAEEKLPQMVYDYYAGGAHDEITLKENRAAYDRLTLRYRVMRDISKRDLSTTLLGEAVSMPIVIAPTAFHRMACDEGERATARAAASAGTIMTLSTLSTLSTSAIEDVAAAGGGPVWFQLYVYKDRAATEGLVRRAEAAGARALVLTADAQVWGRRERDEHNHFQLPDGLKMKNLPADDKDDFPEVDGSGLAAYVNRQFDQALSWKDLDWLCALTDLPVLIKGVVRGDDAEHAVDNGVAGVVVSNHGGRQLDTAPATIEVLPEIVEAVGEDTTVLVDGGIRRGTDVLKALSLGASAVQVGRPILWGLAAGGQQGAEHVLQIFREELDLAMALCGVTSIEEIPNHNLVRGAIGAKKKVMR